MKGLPHVRPLIFVGLTMLLGAGLAPRSAAAEHYAPLSLTCGSAKVTMSCKEGSSCTKTVMGMTTVDGKSVMLAQPKGLEDHTATGMACVAAADKTKYVEVELGDLPRGCEYCEWHALYDLKGRKLSDNTPAILVDKEREAFNPGSGSYPNNDEINLLVKKLGLEKPDIQYIQFGH